jgi:hypothetical protein
MELTDLKAPEPVRGIPPWQDPRWVAAAEDWIDAACGQAALTRTGPAQARGRPYSVVARVPTDNGTVWFKANPPASSFEAALMAALAAWYPDRFTAPIAIDVDRAWSLTRDGGPTLRDQPRAAHRAARPRPDLGSALSVLPRPRRTRGPRRPDTDRHAQFRPAGQLASRTG